MSHTQVTLEDQALECPIPMVRGSVWFLTEGSMDTEANVFLWPPHSNLRAAEKES